MSRISDRYEKRIIHGRMHYICRGCDVAVTRASMGLHYASCPRAQAVAKKDEEEQP